MGQSNLCVSIRILHVQLVNSFPSLKYVFVGMLPVLAHLFCILPLMFTSRAAGLNTNLPVPGLKILSVFCHYMMMCFCFPHPEVGFHLTFVVGHIESTESLQNVLPIGLDSFRSGFHGRKAQPGTLCKMHRSF